MLHLENQRLEVLAEVIFDILLLENQRLQEVETCRGYVSGIAYLTCELDYIGCGSKLTNELITCDWTRYALYCLRIYIWLYLLVLFLYDCALFVCPIGSLVLLICVSR
ncbi:hypothetical protein AHAS_Ahas17G0189800 [Arachis hypogaea]